MSADPSFAAAGVARHAPGKSRGNGVASTLPTGMVVRSLASASALGPDQLLWALRLP